MVGGDVVVMGMDGKFYFGDSFGYVVNLFRVIVYMFDKVVVWLGVYRIVFFVVNCEFLLIKWFVVICLIIVCLEIYVGYM